MEFQLIFLLKSLFSFAMRMHAYNCGYTYTYVQNEFPTLVNYTNFNNDVYSFIGHSNRFLRDPNLEIALLLSSPKCYDTR